MATVNEPEPECHCKEAGQPMTEVGVLHAPGCEWVSWFMGGSLTSDMDRFLAELDEPSGAK